MSRRVSATLVLLVIGVLSVASLSWGRSFATSGSAVLAAVPGATETYTIKLTNTGDQPILCMRFVFAQQAKVISVDQTQGAQTTNASQGFGAQMNPPLPPGGTITWTFHGSYPVNGSGTLDVSPDCSQDFTGGVTGPPAPIGTTNPTTTIVKCKCVQLTLAMKASDVYTAAAQLVPEGDALARLGGLVTWTMTCSAGAGGCTAGFALLPPAKGDLTFKTFAAGTFVPKSGPYKGKTLYRKGKEMPPTILCSGPCNASVSGKFFLQVDSTSDLLPANRAGKTIVLRFKKTCPTETIQELSFTFKANGSLDKGKSTLTK